MRSSFELAISRKIAMGKITLHVLDTMNGCPAYKMQFQFYRANSAGDFDLVSTEHTEKDGRLKRPLFEFQDRGSTIFRLEFHVGDYFRELGVDLPTPAFFDRVIIDFGVADSTEHYHIPLLVSPYGYSTYRGS